MSVHNGIKKKRVPTWVTLVATQSASFGQELSAQSQENDKYLAYIAWLARST